MNAPVRVPLPAQLHLYEQAKADLIASTGLREGDPALADTLDGICDLPDTLAAMVRRMQELKADAEGLVAYEKRLQARREAKLATAARLRDRVQHYMDEAALAKLERPDFLVTWRRNQPPLVIADDVTPEALPERFVRVKREIDRTALRAAVEAGEQVPGVQLGNPTRGIQIR